LQKVAENKTLVGADGMAGNDVARRQGSASRIQAERMRFKQFEFSSDE
jgi:hypothetical protein